MGSGASRDSEEISTQITSVGDSSGGSSVPREHREHHHQQRRSLDGAHQAAVPVSIKHEIGLPPRRPSLNDKKKEESIGRTIMTDSLQFTETNDHLAAELSSDGVRASPPEPVIKPSSSDFDDEDFEQFCGEIDKAIEGHDSVAQMSHRTSGKASISPTSGGLNWLPHLPSAASTGNWSDEAPEVVDHHGRRRSSGGLGPDQTCRETFQINQQLEHHRYNQSAEHQLGYNQQLSRLSHHHHHQQEVDQVHHQQMQPHQQLYPSTSTGTRSCNNVPTMVSAPPPLARKVEEKPVSIWKRPEDLAFQEQMLQVHDKWVQSQRELPSSSTLHLSGMALMQEFDERSIINGSVMRNGRRISDHVTTAPVNSRAPSKKDDIVIQEKEGFDISKFKEANKKVNSHKLDKILPATYKGYNTSLSRQGTLPTLYRGSTSSTLSSSGTPSSDKNRSSPAIGNVKELTYNQSEEALLDDIEKEFAQILENN